ncbi:MAG: 6-phosphofructokinase [Firmicutes bacterium]|nr:6-phosphofructokinase [Bacillota bacterium]HXL04783.1 6-phosphofructokinase [Bacillota bacterium]
MKRIGILTSGGDAPGMNAAIRSATRAALYHGLSVVGICRGYQGLIEGDMFEMTSRSVGDIIQRAGTMLRSARSPEFTTSEGQKKAVWHLEARGVEGLIVIGGDGTLKGAKALSDLGIPTVGIPATVDNDIAYTDYALGFDTAANTAVDAITKIRDTASSHGRNNVIEVMGRDAGHLALAAGLAGGAEYILIPEKPFDIQKICDGIQKGYARGKTHSIIVVAEGVGGYSGPDESRYDSVGFIIGQEVRERTGLETRVTVLGYIQRGGTPTRQDRLLGTMFGSKAVEALIQGDTGKIVGISGEEFRMFDICEVVATRKPINEELYRVATLLSEM